MAYQDQNVINSTADQILRIIQKADSDEFGAGLYLPAPIVKQRLSPVEQDYYCRALADLVETGLAEVDPVRLRSDELSRAQWAFFFATSIREHKLEPVGIRLTEAGKARLQILNRPLLASSAGSLTSDQSQATGGGWGLAGWPIGGVVIVVAVIWLAGTDQVSSFLNSLDCSQSPPQIVQAKMTVFVSTKLEPVRLRTNLDPKAIGSVQVHPADKLQVISGPTCSKGYRWFQVRTVDGKEGWVREGDNNDTDIYFIKPLTDQ